MALSQSDKREIAAMMQAFSERMQQRQPVTIEDMALQKLIEIAGPRLPALGQRFEQSPGIQRPGDVLISDAISTALVPSKRKKAMTKFNRAVKEGMKIVRSSTSYGKKGTIANSKKAFSAVTKSVSKARKGGKLAKSGVLRKVQQKAKGILGTAATMSRKAIKKGPRGRKLRIF